MLYTAGPEKLVIGKFRAIAMGAEDHRVNRVQRTGLPFRHPSITRSVIAVMVCFGTSAP